MLSLTDLEFTRGAISYPKAQIDPSVERASYLDAAKELYKAAKSEVDDHNALMGSGSWLDNTLPDSRALERRWFPLALDAAVRMTTPMESKALSKKKSSKKLLKKNPSSGQSLIKL